MTNFQKVAESLCWKKGDSYCCHKLGMSLEEYQEIKRAVKKIKNEEIEVESLLVDSETTHAYTEDFVSGTAEYKIQTTSCPKSSKEIEELVNLDKSKWKILKYSVRNGSKPDVWLMTVQVGPVDKPHKGELILKTLENYKSEYKPVLAKDLILNTNKEKHCALLALPDFHLDKLVVSGASVTDHIENYNKVFDNLLSKSASTYYLDEIVFWLGNDFFHTDSLHNCTTKGTPLSVNVDWDKAYELGFDLMVKSIEKARRHCNKLNVVLSCGNHSVTKEFYMAHALEMYFKPDKNIVFNRTKDDQKVYKYGETLLCFSHGNNINDKLPLAFATSFYKEWGECKYKEVILADKHHNSEKLFRMQGEANGVRMRIIPSLSGTDQWHKDNLFVGAIQSGISLIYNEKTGKCCEFEERV